ncbi:MAG: helix-turn-helix transcriptional regulator [Beduini sp.]|uniref:helix-turn-helix transcriptional regulator n=1 Tax=Beduini sp. TaxID=1922300 RepID=UPI0011C763A2
MDRRVWYVLKILLKSNETYTMASQIQEMLSVEYDIHCDIKTIYADINKINGFMEEMFGISSYIQVKRKRGYFIEKGILPDAQLRFIYDAIYSSGALSKEEGEELFKKITALSPKSQIDRLHIEKMNSQNKPLFIKMNVILQAINEQKTIIFEYVRYTIDQNGKVLAVKSENGNYEKDVSGHTYFVSPYEVMMHSGHYYLLAYNDIRQEQLSIYRIDRMDLVRTTKMKFVDIREMWDMKQLERQAINMFFSNEVIDLKFLFDKEIFRSVVDQFSDQLIVKSDVSGKYVGEVKEVTLSDGLIGWIMMLGSRITILEPSSLKTKVIQRLKESLAHYH